jgi:hypothetical protein
LEGPSTSLAEFGVTLSHNTVWQLARVYIMTGIMSSYGKQMVEGKLSEKDAKKEKSIIERLFLFAREGLYSGSNPMDLFFLT